MPTTWLLLDCPFLCRRAQHSTGSLAFAGEPTGVLFGFLRAVIELQRRFGTEKVLFCWDQGRPLRKTLFPEYKQSRWKKERTEEEKAVEDGYQQQVRLLRTEYLAGLGFRNNFSAEGYEADDMIASLCDTLLVEHPEDSIVIVSADHDLYQLLDSHTVLWNPSSKKLMTDQILREHYFVRPDQWAKVKAIAGCRSDGVPGVHRVGERTACWYLNGSLAEKAKAYQAIEDGWGLVVRNLPLVALPFPGTPTFEPQEDDVRPSKWRDLTERLGMGSLRDLFR